MNIGFWLILALLLSGLALVRLRYRLFGKPNSKVENFSLPTLFIQSDMFIIQNQAMNPYGEFRAGADITDCFAKIIKDKPERGVNIISQYLKSDRQDALIVEMDNNNSIFINKGTGTINGHSYTAVAQIHSLSSKNILDCEVGHLLIDQFTEYFDNAPVAKIVLDKKLNIVACNKKFTSITKEIITFGTNFLNLLESGNNGAATLKLNVFKKEEGSNAIEIFLKEIDKNYTTGFVNSCKNFIYIYLYDNSFNQQVQIKLLQSQKLHAMGELVGGIAHDFNNLLTGIIGFCDILLSQTSNREDSYTDLVQIKQNADRATVLIRHLLAFSRQQNLQTEAIDIVEQLEDLYLLLERLAGEKISIEIKHIAPIPLFYSDKGQLEQIIVNMVVNARDAMPNGGDIAIITRYKKFLRKMQYEDEVIMPGNYVEIMIADSGCGIKKDIIHLIFDPFFSTKGAKGTGLGLATAYGTVKQLGGFIAVNSQENQGTTFKIYLPSEAPVDNTTTEEDSKEEIPKKKEPLIEDTPKAKDNSLNIVLVEDELPVRVFGCKALKNKGYSVTEADNGEDALHKIENMIAKKINIDLIITDVIMPKMDGPTLGQHIEKILPKTPVLFISGYCESSFRDRIANNKHIHFLPKPFTLQEFVSKVDEIIKGVTSN